ncbi:MULTISPECIES: hypothetical protein [unclassified Streptomyces]|uniref:hypothetical protein n=1 Tax=unclassified Streptomyces TaxID=2593676 RepID=UPI002DDBBA29|nr:hypothetical protein [Streptomyces sp. NBC_01761]WSC56880.1 hypothetical protein OG808_34045 [Streptomyces sp. NBC_01761]WSF87724.1 hypothetical protein OIE70_34170 [Streptomyces sp. NBC_01744]
MRIVTKALVATASAAVLAMGAPAQAVVPPEHAVIVCQSASFYANYDSSSGPTGLIRVLGYGNKVGHTRGAHPATFDFGKGDWGYVRNECLGGYGSW